MEPVRVQYGIKTNKVMQNNLIYIDQYDVNMAVSFISSSYQCFGLPANQELSRT